tara:strand:- start:594 stop:1811 length:1218 start_codon:yes stop_codon:yes gene_type:complete
MLNLFNRIRIQIHNQNLSFIDMKEMVPVFDFYAKCLLVVAVLSRMLFAALAVMITLKTENGFLVSPFVEIPFGDYGFYLKHMSEHFASLKEPFLFFYQGDSFDAWLERPLAPGPLFPWLLNILSYPKQPLALASVYLIASALLVFGWALYYRAQEVSLWGQLALIAFPLLLWYSLVLSTELPMSIALFMFFCGALAIPRRPFGGISCALIGFILMLLIRPNSLSLFPAILTVLFLNRKVMSKWCALAVVTLTTFIFAYFVVYYAPYFLMVQKSSLVISYWGLFPQQYSEGLFPNLLPILDQIISNGALIISKLIYASGLRPSYSDVPAIFVFMRGMGGMLILPGIFYCFYRGSWLERVLLLGFLFPLLITVAQERYLLPIAPLLLLYGAIFWKDLYLSARKHFCL